MISAHCMATFIMHNVHFLLPGRDSVLAQSKRNDLDLDAQRSHVTDDERHEELVRRLADQILRYVTS